MKSSINYKWTAVMAVVIAFTSCSDDVLEQNPPDIITADNLYVDDAGFENGLNGLYAQARRIRSGAADGGSNALMTALALGGTDLVYCNRAWNSERFLNDWGVRVNPAESYFNTVWDWLYEIINASNTIIDRASDNSLELRNRDRILAEARFFRAFAYRHLTYLYGDVPLVTQESTGDNIRFDWTRTPVQEVREFMKADLEFAVDNLPETFLHDGKIIKATAQHYLAELLIQTGDYTGAISVAEDAINNGSRSLVTARYGVNANNPGTPYTDMFLDGNSNPAEGNTEALWVFQNDEFVEGGDGNNLMRRWFMSEYSSGSALGLTVTVDRGGRGNTRLSATSFMLGLYERDDNGNVLDDRGGPYAWRSYFVVQPIDDEEGNVPDGYAVGDTIFLDFTPVDPQGDRLRPYSRKWDSAPASNPSESHSFDDQVFLRLADTYLLLAEAQVMNGEPAAAATTINALRERVHASPVTAADVDIDLVLDERARELYTESERRYALLRNGKWLERTRLHNVAAGPNVTDRDKLYPIPQDFIDSNLEFQVENNPGY